MTTAQIPAALENEASGPIFDVANRTISEWTVRHNLAAEEIARIRSVLADPDIEDIDAAMIEELEGVLAARRIAKMNPPTAESMQAIRTAFAEGRLPVKSLPVD